MTHTTENDTLGTCPRCDESIPTSNLLIRYESSGGTARYAECPACVDPVHPI